MTNQQKAELYTQLMYEHTKIQNKISSIKGESINLNEQQLLQIRDLENKLRFLMNKVSKLSYIFFVNANNILSGNSSKYDLAINLILL